jgi:chromatin remodeling complex protein RSC6
MDSSYKVKIEGRLLDDESEEDDEDADDAKPTDHMVEANGDEAGKAKPKASATELRHKFSHFFKSMTVEYERGRGKDGAEQSVEWKKPASNPTTVSPPGSADFDALEFKRGGDENVNIIIILVPDEAQERFLLSAPLAEIMDAQEATRAEVVAGIWQYIKANQLQEDDEKRSFRCDPLLRPVSQPYHEAAIKTLADVDTDLPARHRLHSLHPRRHHPAPLPPAARQAPLHYPRRPGLPPEPDAHHLRRARVARRPAPGQDPRLQLQPRLSDHAARDHFPERPACRRGAGDLALQGEAHILHQPEQGPGHLPEEVDVLADARPGDPAGRGAARRRRGRERGGVAAGRGAERVGDGERARGGEHHAEPAAASVDWRKGFERVRKADLLHGSWIGGVMGRTWKAFTVLSISC